MASDAPLLLVVEDAQWLDRHAHRCVTLRCAGGRRRVQGVALVRRYAGLPWSRLWLTARSTRLRGTLRSLSRAAARSARERGAGIVGASLARDVDASALERVGFERGWEPWWMAAALESVAPPDDPRVTITAQVPEYGPEGQRLLSLTDARDARTWHAVARLAGRFAGRAWAFAPSENAGIYDMHVWPRFQRQGLGRALLRQLCWSARCAGAHVAVLNATPDGHALYSVEGFARIGTGITYWHHLA